MLPSLKLKPLTWDEYQSLDAISSNAIYFISDRHCIFLRNNPYGFTVNMYDDEIVNPMKGIFYIQKNTLQVKFWDEEWFIVSNGYTDTVIENSDASPTSDAVFNFVIDEISKSISALQVLDKEVDGEFVVSVSEENGKVSLVRRALKESDIPEIEKDKIAGLTEDLEDINTGIDDAKKIGINAQKSADEVKRMAESNKQDIDLINGTGTSSVYGKINEKIQELDLPNTYEKKGEADKVQKNLSDYIKSNDEAVKHAQESANAANDEAKKKVSSLSPKDKSIVIEGAATDPTIHVNISDDADNAMKLTTKGLKVTLPIADKYDMIKDDTATEGYSATYHLTKNGVNIGAAINIPKDMVVQSGSVVELGDGEIEGYDAGVYIKLVLANAENSEIYIPANSLIEYVTSGSNTGDMVFINIDKTTHKVTAYITDGTITKEKLTIEIQALLDKAHNHPNIDVLNGITESQVTEWNGAKSYADEQDTKILKSAKEYSDSLSENYDKTGSAAESLKNAKKYTDDSLIEKLSWGVF